MKSLIPLILFALFAIRASAQTSIPPDLVGEWRPEDRNDKVVFFLRSDGLAVMLATVGAGGIALYDANSHSLTVSLRHERTGAEVGKMIWRFDPKGRTLTAENKGKQAAFKRHSSELPEPYKSVDLMKLTGQSK